MRSLLPGIVTALALASLGLAQRVPAPQPSQPSNRQAITVRGCIKKRTIVATQSSASQAGVSYRLRGSKSVLNNLKEHDGHDDEVVGTTQIADDKKFAVGKEKKVGKTRVYGAASAEESNDFYQRPEDLWIDVETVTHVSSKCVGR
jgi:hypothetical protein